MNKIFLLLISLIFLEGCGQTEHPVLNHMGSFPSKLREVSGIEIIGKNIWVIQDSGNKDVIYNINKKGKIKEELKINHAKNQDWEDLASDKKGNIYIGDFGNNNNERKDLTIYKIDSTQMQKKEPKAKKIKFRYPQQHQFPPKKDSLFFDTEAFFHWNDSLYIFTKNRSRPYTGETLIYRIPDEEGDYNASFIGSLVLCKDQNHCSVTGADISPDGKIIALLTYGKIFFLSDFKAENLANPIIESIDLKHVTQTESIGFLNNTTLLIADEQTLGTGRNLYSYSLD
ncbi:MULTISPECIES: hypothetical protein [Flavobacteriaceae]|uniref:hypothetical protein n=1 Tax=Flavobacteriaceae TaxID=49546 RepID=UPI001491D1DB|nr:MULTISPECIES: hypothetical protein [Allomuricauda]MDC6365502.1 hypothetical protein [Muricauda sp. AC10]